MEKYYQEICLVIQVIQTLIGLAGIVGNITVICVFRRSKSLKKRSYSFYYQVMAWNDICILAHTMRNWSFDYKVNSLSSPVMCRLLDYHVLVTGSVSLWLRTLIQLDQLNSIVYMNRLDLLKKKSVQVMLISASLLLSMLLYLTLPLNNHIDPLYETAKPMRICFIRSEILGRNLIVSFINLLCNLLVNLLLNIKVIHFRRVCRRRCLKHLRIGLNQRRDRKLALASIGRNLICFIFKAPFSLCVVISSYFQLTIEQTQLLFAVTLTIGVLKNAATFFIEFALNSLFHEAFFEMFRSTSISVDL